MGEDFVCLISLKKTNAALLKRRYKKKRKSRMDARIKKKKDTKFMRLTSKSLPGGWRGKNKGCQPANATNKRNSNPAENQKREQTSKPQNPTVLSQG